MDNPSSSIIPLSPRRDSQQSETPKAKFVTPQKAPVIAASSNEKTLILGRDTIIRFSEVANSESGGSEVFVVEMPKSEWREFMVWKRRLASFERLLDERPLKQLNMGKSMGDLKSSSSIHGFESHESSQMKDQTFIQSNEGTDQIVSLDPGLVSDAEIAKNCLELNDCTESCKGLVSDDATVNNGPESNDSTEGVVLDSEENGLISDVEIAKNRSGDKMKN